MRIIWLVLISLLCSCIFIGGVHPYIYTEREYHSSVTREIPIWVDRDFGAGDGVEIFKAISAWNYVLNGYIHLRVVDMSFDMEVSKIKEQIREGGWLIMKTNSGNRMIPVASNSENRIIGWSDHVGGNRIWLIRDRMFNDDVFGICLHEMGHLLGSRHVGHRLMDPIYTRDKFSCVDVDSMESVARYNHLPADRLNYCVLQD